MHRLGETTEDAGLTNLEEAECTDLEEAECTDLGKRNTHWHGDGGGIHQLEDGGTQC
jgi:hypothetical protein